MKNTTKILITIAMSYGIYFLFDALFFKQIRGWFFEHFQQLGISHILAYLITGIPLFLGILLISGTNGFFQSLGLNTSIQKVLVFSFVCVLPMFIGFSFLFDFNTEVSLNNLLISVIAAGFFEELYFRGFLFGLPFLKTKLGFISAVFFGALYFGALHLYQSTEISEIVGIFLVTFLGGILFAWVYAEWNFNIWAPIFLHMLMNLSWELFSVSDTALGGLYANIFRIATVAIIIIGTVFYKKRKGERLKINKRNLLFQKKAFPKTK